MHCCWEVLPSLRFLVWYDEHLKLQNWVWIWLALGRVFLALNEVFGKTSCRFEAFIRRSLELSSSGWIKKSLLFGSSLMQLILSRGILFFIEQAKWTCFGLGLIVIITGLIVWIGFWIILGSLAFVSDLNEVLFILWCFVCSVSCCRENCTQLAHFGQRCFENSKQIVSGRLKSELKTFEDKK